MSDQNPAPEPEDTLAEPIEAPPAESASAESASTSSANEDSATEDSATEVASTEFVEPPTLVEPPVESASTGSATVDPVLTSSATVEPASTSSATVVEEPAVASDAEPVIATSDPAAVETAASVPAEHRVVYVEAPQPPRRKNNRGVGFVIAIVAAIVYAVLYALAALVIFPLWAPGAPVSTGFSNFLGSTVFWVPVLFFFVFFVVLVLLANRASWWAYVLGGNFVALIVYFGSVGVFLLQANVVILTPAAAGRKFGVFATEPFVIVAGLLALELTIWAGAIVAARGRRVKAKNLQARDAWERETSENQTDSGMVAR